MVIALLGAAVAVWARQHLFPALSWNRDEPVYLWQVDVLSAGRLTAPDGGHPELFGPWLSARADGMLFTQYTLGWPLVLWGARAITGTVTSALALGAGLAVLGTYAFAWELTRDRALAIVASLLLVASPILPIQGGVHLSYLFTLGLGLLFGVGLLSGIRLGCRWRLVGSGLLLGWIFMTRPYDAALWAIAFGGYAVVVQRARWRSLIRPALLCAAGAVPIVLATLAYNHRVTGEILRFPVAATDPLDTLGFGTRRLMPAFDAVEYGATKALEASAKNLFFLPWFLVGSYVGLVAAAAGLWLRRGERSTLALLFVGAAFPLGYFVFWGNWVSSQFARISGPIYLVPLFAPLSVLVATALLAAWRERRTLAVGLTALLLLGTLPFAQSRFAVNREISDQQEPWRKSVDALEGRALVFVADGSPYLLFLNPFSSNGPALDDRILYAADAGPAMLDLVAEMPDRKAYLQQGSVPPAELGPREDPRDLAVTITPIEVMQGRSLQISATITPVPGAARIAVLLEADGVRDLRFGAASAETQNFSFQVAATGSGEENMLPERGTISVTVGYGDTDADALRSIESRHDVHFRTHGGILEALTAAAAFRLNETGGSPAWLRVPEDDRVRVSVSPTPAGEPRTR